MLKAADIQAPEGAPPRAAALAGPRGGLPSSACTCSDRLERGQAPGTPHAQSCLFPTALLPESSQASPGDRQVHWTPRPPRARRRCGDPALGGAGAHLAVHASPPADAPAGRQGRGEGTEGTGREAAPPAPPAGAAPLRLLLVSHSYLPGVPVLFSGKSQCSH